jgi:hypothetical protein
MVIVFSVGVLALLLATIFKTVESPLWRVVLIGVGLGSFLLGPFSIAVQVLLIVVLAVKEVLDNVKSSL